MIYIMSITLKTKQIQPVISRPDEFEEFAGLDVGLKRHRNKV